MIRYYSDVISDRIETYTKKPVEVQVVKFDGSQDCLLALERFGLFDIDGLEVFPDYLIIPTLEGNMKVSIGDYVIKGVEGEFYPCKPEIFKKTYEQKNAKQKTSMDKFIDYLNRNKS